MPFERSSGPGDETEVEGGKEVVGRAAAVSEGRRQVALWDFVATAQTLKCGEVT